MQDKEKLIKYFCKEAGITIGQFYGDIVYGELTLRRINTLPYGIGFNVGSSTNFFKV